MGAPGLWYPHEILLIKFGGNYYVEVPAIDHALPKQLHKKMKTKLTRIKNIANNYSVSQKLDPDHNLTYSKIRQPEQQKFLDPEISKKIAYAIDEIISNKEPAKGQAKA